MEPKATRRLCVQMNSSAGLSARLEALGPAARAELLHVLMLPDFDRAARIGEFWSYPQSRTFAEGRALARRIVVETDEAKLVVKDPDSTRGLEIYARPGSWVMGGRVELEIRKLYCPEDYSCTWIAAG